MGHIMQNISSATSGVIADIMREEELLDLWSDNMTDVMGPIETDMWYKSFISDEAYYEGILAHNGYGRAYQAIRSIQASW